MREFEITKKLNHKFLLNKLINLLEAVDIKF
jgi:hypothetical protein